MRDYYDFFYIFLFERSVSRGGACSQAYVSRLPRRYRQRIRYNYLGPCDCGLVSNVLGRGNYHRTRWQTRRDGKEGKSHGSLTRQVTIFRVCRTRYAAGNGLKCGRRIGSGYSQSRSRRFVGDIGRRAIYRAPYIRKGIMTSRNMGRGGCRSGNGSGFLGFIF